MVLQPVVQLPTNKGFEHGTSLGTTLSETIFQNDQGQTLRFSGTPK